MKLFIFASLLATGVASAEVKPPGTLLESLCGNPTKSLRVCVATRVGDPNKYLTLATFQVGKTLAKVRSTHRSPGVVKYVAWAPGPGAAAVMVNYELVVRSGPKGSVANLKINGSPVGLHRFKMETIFHTMSVGF